MDGSNPPAIRSTTAVTVTACLLACASTGAVAQTGAIMIPIEKMTIGAAPTDFEFARTGQGATGQWVVLEDASAASKRAIEQSNTDRTDHRFPLAIYQPTSTKNVEVSLRFKPLAGRVDQAGGIAVRLSTPDDYYVARANALEDNVRFYRVVKGKREQLASANAKVEPNQWHTLGIKAENDRFTVTFDGKQLHSTTDKTFSAPGRVALWTKSDSVTRFDQINIQVLP